MVWSTFFLQLPVFWDQEGHLGSPMSNVTFFGSKEVTTPKFSRKQVFASRTLTLVPLFWERQVAWKGWEGIVDQNMGAKIKVGAAKTCFRLNL